eukprot:TRINITY_DN5446_c0_g1_i5.p1 TRINITY_DN5446_c0_g1~~TRINITY_DN5446_c0_g1_i5.p1  ORF type:complete len:221 (-),score=74.06 TRINITY_DN5446_c0_g1_i5:144-806(-)
MDLEKQFERKIAAEKASFGSEIEGLKHQITKLMSELEISNSNLKNQSVEFEERLSSRCQQYDNWMKEAQDKAFTSESKVKIVEEKNNKLQFEIMKMNTELKTAKGALDGVCEERDAVKQKLQNEREDQHKRTLGLMDDIKKLNHELKQEQSFRESDRRKAATDKNDVMKTILQLNKQFISQVSTAFESSPSPTMFDNQPNSEQTPSPISNNIKKDDEVEK